MGSFTAGDAGTVTAAGAFCGGDCVRGDVHAQARLTLTSASQACQCVMATGSE